MTKRYRKPRVTCPNCASHEMIEYRSMCDWCWKTLPGKLRRKVYKLCRALDPWWHRRKREWNDAAIEADKAQFEAAYTAYRRGHGILLKLARRNFWRSASIEERERLLAWQRDRLAAQRQEREAAALVPADMPQDMQTELKALGLI